LLKTVLRIEDTEDGAAADVAHIGPLSSKLLVGSTDRSIPANDSENSPSPYLRSPGKPRLMVSGTDILAQIFGSEVAKAGFIFWARVSGTVESSGGDFRNGAVDDLGYGLG
jgi:hypothetical protein